MEDGAYRLTAFAGFFTLAGVAWLTGSRRSISWKTIGGSLLLIWALGVLVFLIPGSRSVLRWINDALVALLTAAKKGIVFLFGPLALGPGQTLPDGAKSIGFILGTQVLPAVILFSAFIAGLYYLKIMPAVVRFFGRIFYRSMNLSGAEAMAGSANIFVGIESSLTIRPYLKDLTRSELLTLLTCMMATVASTVLAVYVLALQGVFPQIAGHLVSASVISIPCAVLISKLSLPEEGIPQTQGQMPKEDSEGLSDPRNEKPANLMVALIEGGTQGVKMAVAIATLLIVVLGLEALVDLSLNQFPAVNGSPLSLTRIMGWITWPFVVLLGLRPEEWRLGAEILGSRFIETEVTAYFSLAAAQAANPAPFSIRSFASLSYALCGFVHIASMGIFVGGLSALVPSRVKDISVLGFRALWTSFLATLLTGCVAGVLFQGG